MCYVIFYCVNIDDLSDLKSILFVKKDVTFLAMSNVVFCKRFDLMEYQLENYLMFIVLLMKLHFVSGSRSSVECSVIYFELLTPIFLFVFNSFSYNFPCEKLYSV